MESNLYNNKIILSILCASEMGGPLINAKHFIDFFSLVYGLFIPGSKRCDEINLSIIS